MLAYKEIEWHCSCLCAKRSTPAFLLCFFLLSMSQMENRLRINTKANFHVDLSVLHGHIYIWERAALVQKCILFVACGQTGSGRFTGRSTQEQHDRGKNRCKDVCRFVYRHKSSLDISCVRSAPYMCVLSISVLCSANESVRKPKSHCGKAVYRQCFTQTHTQKNTHTLTHIH